ncbi:MAG: hypothetical protein IPK60_10190 [Sandaracinaceae bacterium]|nr:hypothetical protein [Sandaracinaceae bacterium]
MLTVFVSLCLVACSVLLLAVTLKYRTQDHAERLALLPMDDETKVSQQDSEQS